MLVNLPAVFARILIKLFVHSERGKLRGLCTTISVTCMFTQVDAL